MNNKLIVFDLDGTLLNTIGDLADSCNFMLHKRGLKEHTYDDYCNFVGNGITRLVERALPEEKRNSDYIACARQDFMDYYIDHIDKYTTPYDGIESVVSSLFREGYKLAIASNKFHAGTCKLVQKFFPDIEFDAVYGNRESVPMKPDATLLHQIMDECSSMPQETFMVGDSGIDMQFAANAGVHSIGVTWGFRTRDELEANNANKIAVSPKEILQFVKGI